MIKSWNNNGFTLMEVAVVLGIFGMLILGVGSILVNAFKTRGIVWEQLGTQSEGRRVVGQFVNEVRRAVPSAEGAYPVELAEADEIVFYSNIDLDAPAERIHYLLQDNILMKGVTQPEGSPPTYNTSTEVWNAVVHSIDNNVNNPIFTYYGEDYEYTTTSTLPLPTALVDVRMVGISLVMEKDPVYSPTAFYIESKAKIRNNKAN